MQHTSKGKTIVIAMIPPAAPARALAVATNIGPFFLGDAMLTQLFPLVANSITRLLL